MHTCQFWLDVYKQTGHSTSYGLYRALMPYDCCVHLHLQDLVVRPLVLVGSDWTDMALSSPWHHMDESEVSLGSRYVGPWVINLVPSSCMSLLQLKVGNRALMIFTGWCWIICNFHYKINIIILTCEYHNVPPFSPLSHAFTQPVFCKWNYEERPVWAMGVWGTANYRVMAQLPTTNFCNWVVDSSNLPCGQWGVVLLWYSQVSMVILIL